MELKERLALVANQPHDDTQVQVDAFAAIRERVHSHVISELSPLLFDDEDVDKNELRVRVRSEIRGRLANEPELSLADRERLTEEITDEVLGLGPIERLLADESITEIMVNGPWDVWIERKGRLH